LRDEDRARFPDHEDIRHDLREAYLSWRADGATFIDIGRVNLKSGVALGFNPTDFFRTRAVVEPLSADPSALREDRLGTLMVLGEHIWPSATLSVAYAPKLEHETPVYTNTHLPSFGAAFDRTNAHTRLLVKTSITLANDFAPELIFYSEDGDTRFGV